MMRVLRVVLDYVNLVFWWTMFTLYISMINAIRFLVPRSLVKAKVIQVFESIGIKVTCNKDEIGKYDKSKYSVELVVNDDRFFQHRFGSSVEFGETYLKGYIDCDNIAEMIRLTAGIPVVGPRLANRVALARNRQGIHESMDVIDIHYNLGNDLYMNMLDEGMSYTCGLWYPETETLEEAQFNKIDIIGRKLKLKPGMKVLDIGGGFGAAAKYLAENFGVSVTVYNISKEQVKYGRENCKDVDVTFVIADYRTATGEYDAIYSIGFFEHVGNQNYAEYFALVNRCLKPEGLALTHTIITADHQTRTDSWICKYIFPGGELPFMRDLLTESTKFKLVTEDIHSFAKSYAKTLHCWNDNFVKNWDKHLKQNYEHLFDGKFYRIWTYYLGFCEGVFLERTAQLIQVIHSKYGRQQEYYSVRDQRS